MSVPPERVRRRVDRSSGSDASEAAAFPGLAAQWRDGRLRIPTAARQLRLPTGFPDPSTGRIDSAGEDSGPVRAAAPRPEPRAGHHTSHEPAEQAPEPGDHSLEQTEDTGEQAADCAYEAAEQTHALAANAAFRAALEPAPRSAAASRLSLRAGGPVAGELAEGLEDAARDGVRSACRLVAPS